MIFQKLSSKPQNDGLCLKDNWNTMNEPAFGCLDLSDDNSIHGLAILTWR